VVENIVTHSRTARLLDGSSEWPYGRQSPTNNNIFGQTKYYFGPGSEPTDWLVVMNSIPDEGDYSFPKDRTLFFSGEPASVRTFSTDYLAQFGTVWSCDPQVRHPHRIFRSPPLPWHVGIETRNNGSYEKAKTFIDFAGKVPPKSKLCSCICSTKASTRGHRARLEFVDRLRVEFAGTVDFYGRGFSDMPDKDAALAPYRYHIAIENASIPNYWTEKLGDAFLRNCFPIYSGATNAGEYFNPGSFLSIDITDPDAAVKAIRTTINSEIASRSAAAVEQSKHKILWEYNILAAIDRFAEAAELAGEATGERERIRPEGSFREISLWQKTISAGREAIRGALTQRRPRS
jgi:hypothetical protein